MPMFLEVEVRAYDPVADTERHEWLGEARVNGDDGLWSGLEDKIGAAIVDRQGDTVSPGRLHS